MPKWFEEYLKSLPDYKVDELIAWTGTGPDIEHLKIKPEASKEFLRVLVDINT